MRRPTITLLLVAVLLLAGGVSLYLRRSAPAGSQTVITLYRAFGGCSDEYAGVTDLERAVGECGVIQVLTNKFNAENRIGARVSTQAALAGGYYDRLSAAFAARRPPDVAVMHQDLLPDFVQRGVLSPLRSDLAAAGVSWDDFVPAALEGVSLDGNVYGLPFDLHALLWHMNLDLLSRAGLVSDDGAPRLPTSPEELLAQARQLKERTGKRYFAIPSVTDPMPVWMFETWVWQQKGLLIAPDRRASALDSPEGLRALDLLSSLYDHGFANRGQDYVGAEQAFLNGDAAVLLNGTWVVNSYLSQSRKKGALLSHYGVRTIPKLFAAPDVWSNSHVWVMPRSERRDERTSRAVIAFLKFLYDNSGAWARTGHLPVRKSVLQSDAFLSLPLRRGYVDTARFAHVFEPVENQRAILSALGQEINATWLAPRAPKESLTEAARQIDEVLERSSRRAAAMGERAKRPGEAATAQR